MHEASAYDVTVPHVHHTRKEERGKDGAGRNESYQRGEALDQDRVGLLCERRHLMTPRGQGGHEIMIKRQDTPGSGSGP